MAKQLYSFKKLSSTFTAPKSLRWNQQRKEFLSNQSAPPHLWCGFYDSRLLLVGAHILRSSTRHSLKLPQIHQIHLVFFELLQLGDDHFLGWVVRCESITNQEVRLLFPNLGELLSQWKSLKKHHSVGKNVRIQQTSKHHTVDKHNYDWIKECKLSFSNLSFPSSSSKCSSRLLGFQSCLRGTWEPFLLSILNTCPKVERDGHLGLWLFCLYIKKNKKNISHLSYPPGN